MSFDGCGSASARLLRIEYFGDGRPTANTLFLGRRLVRKLAAVAAVLAVVAISACKKTGEGEYQVEKPVVGTVTDTINTPSIDVGKDTVAVTVPTVDVKSGAENKKR